MNANDLCVWRRVALTCAVGLALAMTAAAAAQDGGDEDDFNLDWNTVDCGGGEATGVDEVSDDWTVEGTIGQADAGFMESGEGEGGMAGTDEDGDVFTLEGGFWPVPAPICPTDLTRDGTTGVDDLVQVILHWGQSGAPADLNYDGTVDVDDLVAIILAWGPCA